MTLIEGWEASEQIALAAVLATAFVAIVGWIANWILQARRFKHERQLAARDAARVAAAESFAAQWQMCEELNLKNAQEMYDRRRRGTVQEKTKATAANTAIREQYLASKGSALKFLAMAWDKETQALAERTIECGEATFSAFCGTYGGSPGPSTVDRKVQFDRVGAALTIHREEWFIALQNLVEGTLTS